MSFLCHKVKITILFVLFCFKASPEDVNVAFRRLSKMFHPDKHVNPVQKKQAEIMFNKVKRAHEGIFTEFFIALDDCIYRSS